jgi:hypothetical protein
MQAYEASATVQGQGDVYVVAWRGVAVNPRTVSIPSGLTF